MQGKIMWQQFQSTKNWIFAGWSTSKDAKVAKGISEDQMIGTEKFNGEQTYYAIWMQTSGYWLGTKGAIDSYTDEAYFATHDDNYVPASTIESDMKTLKDSTATDYPTVKGAWDGYYSRADSATVRKTYQVRLYVASLNRV